MAETKVENMDSIKMVDEKEILNDSIASIKKAENVESQSMKTNDANEENVELAGAVEVKGDQSLANTEGSNTTKTSASEKTRKEDAKINAKLNEADDDEKSSKNMGSSDLDIKDVKNILEEEKTLNEILKVVHENLSSAEIQQLSKSKEDETDGKELKKASMERLKREGKKENADSEASVRAQSETVSSEANSETKHSVEIIEHTEVGIVGPPTTVSELINEEELQAESALSNNQKVQDHIAEWVQNSAKAEDLVADEEEASVNNVQQATKNTREKRTRKKRSNDVLVLPTRKSQRVISNIIKRSIKW